MAALARFGLLLAILFLAVHFAWAFAARAGIAPYFSALWIVFPAAAIVAAWLTPLPREISGLKLLLPVSVALVATAPLSAYAETVAIPQDYSVMLIATVAFGVVVAPISAAAAAVVNGIKR